MYEDVYWQDMEKKGLFNLFNKKKAGPADKLTPPTEAGNAYAPIEVANAPREGSPEARAAWEADRRVFEEQAAARYAQMELEGKQRQEAAVRNIPHLFEETSFSDLSVTFSLLKAADAHIKIGDKTYAAADLYKVIEAVSTFSYQQLGLPAEEKASAQDIDAYLARSGITRAKIEGAPESSPGFRDCMKQCIQHDSRAVIRRS